MPSNPRFRGGIGTTLEKEPGELLITVLRSPVERGHPITLRAIHVGALLQQGTNGSGVCLPRGVRDPRVARSRRGRC
jgi:hypothetical protein